MDELFAAFGSLALGFILGGGAVAVVALRRMSAGRPRPGAAIARLMQAHFAPTPLANLTISERKFPFRVRADLQRRIDQLFGTGTTIRHFCGVRKYSHEGLTLVDCIVADRHSPTISAPPQYEEIDIGDQEPVRCLKNGLWFLEEGNAKYVVVVAPATSFGEITGIQVQIGVVNDEAGTRLTQRFFNNLEDSVLQAESYRGKILSLEQQVQGTYRGASNGITVHKLRTVARDQVILPRKTLELLDRNVIQFTRQRPQLAKFKQSTKKGLLFYGPPGTGKTHTIHYLARALEGHTTLLISAEQVGLLAEYMALARLLQPSVVVMEDVDLIARERTQMNSPCEEVLLNKLLNEMDGLKEEADILFILTTNHPEALERALSSRPGRIDQAIEFPLPDDEGREKLIRLYAPGIEISPSVVQVIVQRTDNVSAAFIKELMRRSVQFHLERNGDGRIEALDVEQALQELLFSGGSLNLKLLGAQAKEGASLHCLSDY